MSAPGTVAWFAHHEFRLAWRDWIAMMTAGRRRVRTLIVVLAVFAVFMHAVAFAVVSRFGGMAEPDKTALVVISGAMVLAWSLMLSQAMESVTRALYARSDLDLLLSSPAQAQRIFAVRMLTIAISVMAMAMFIAAPFIDVLAVQGGARWLGAYPTMAAIGAAAAAVATLTTTALFAAIGAQRTRLVAQIVAAVIGAAFVITLQFAAIMSTGTLSRFAVLASEPIVAVAPDLDSAGWWPARAVLGDAGAIAIVLGVSLALLGAAITLTAPRFAGCALAAAGLAGPAIRQRRRVDFRAASPLAMLRRKEWALLRRDPWLASQTTGCSSSICCRRHFSCGEASATALAPRCCWCRSSSWQPASLRAASPGSRSRGRMPRSSLPPRRSPPAESCAPRSRPSWARSQSCSRR